MVLLRSGPARSAACPPCPSPGATYDSPCLSCHRGIETIGGTIFGRRFGHERHVVGAKLDCSSCHRPHEERADSEVVRFGEAGCESCHHRDVGADCLTCHDGIRGRTVKSPLGDFDHTLHLDTLELACAQCHDLSPGKPVVLKRETCDGCHG